MSQPDAFFVSDGDDRFVATEHGRGPWSPAHQHAGPPSALLARAIERAIAGDPAVVARLTVELFSPVPIGPLDAGSFRIRMHCEDDGNRGCGLFQGLHKYRAPRHDQVHIESNQVGREFWEPSVVALMPAGLDQKILSLNPPALLQT